MMVRRAAFVACIVGPTLVIINQPGAVFGEQAFDIFKTLLTFLVPFCVSLASSLMMLKTITGERAQAAQLAKDLAQQTARADRAEAAQTAEANSTTSQRVAAPPPPMPAAPKPPRVSDLSLIHISEPTRPY